VASQLPPYTMTRGANLVIHFCPLLHVRVVYFLTLFLPIYISSTRLDYVCIFFFGTCPPYLCIFLPFPHIYCYFHHFCFAPPRPYLIYVIHLFGLFMISMSLPFSSILHRIFHHLLLFTFLPPCVHLMCIFSTRLYAHCFFHRPFLTILFR
jgi:hypothetical protein